jgi:hypothetical protein
MPAISSFQTMKASMAIMANVPHMARSFVQKAHELLIQFINGLAMYGNAQQSKNGKL